MMSEGELLTAILALCRDLGVLAFHSTDSRRDVGKGFPDLVLCGRRRTIFAELKDTTNSRTPEQVTWHYALKASGQECFLWRPHDLASGWIARTIESL